MKLRFSQNLKRHRGKNDVDFASLTRRVMKSPMPHAKTQLQNPKRQRGKNNVEFASLTRRVTKNPMPHAKTQLQKAMPGAILELPRWGVEKNRNQRRIIRVNTKD
ncbi:MAG: hypothetical protein ACF8AM_15225 [Rhodopirellula sp. JB055]|uniref:hypothetical protein n=1 Tax=Rhodopirellula sp. JB055 TaxID=3342846 RepID=UPI00370B9E29